MVVKLLPFFFVFEFFCGFDLFFVLFCLCLVVCMLFLFSVSAKELIPVNSLAVMWFPYFVLCLLLR